MNARPTQARTFTLIADDYAMTPAVSRGILSLLETGRISGTGAMTNRPSWAEAARALRDGANGAELGLHLNLTCGEALTGDSAFAPSAALPKLSKILAQGITGSLALPTIEAEIAAQLAEFEQYMGRAPDFVDGHQHAHAMPGVRRALARVLAARYPQARPWVRDAADSFSAIRARGRYARKALLLSLLTRPFAAGMRKLGFRLNKGFSGYSGFDPAGDYAADFASYLVSPGAAHLIMCHPGEVDDALRALDPVTESRRLELAFFASSRFTEICAASGAMPGRLAPL
ncbi:MAG: ChbG/HpnK family deacetylase [Proteobacteria bacterium]|nr:ChbG/HpnK family deacetylase [Pseudomonadota bacterium]